MAIVENKFFVVLIPKYVQANVRPLASDTIVSPRFAVTAQTHPLIVITHPRCEILVHPFFRAGTRTQNEAKRLSIIDAIPVRTAVHCAVASSHKYDLKLHACVIPWVKMLKFITHIVFNILRKYSRKGQTLRTANLLRC